MAPVIGDVYYGKHTIESMEELLMLFATTNPPNPSAVMRQQDKWVRCASYEWAQ